MNLENLVAVSREGPLLTEHEDEVRKLASEVQFSGSEGSALDGKHALAWLLWYRHEHACTREPIGG